MDQPTPPEPEITPAAPVVSIVVVNYESWADVERLASQLVPAPEVVSGQIELIVVDNASTGPVPSCFESPGPCSCPGPIRLIRRADNGGFAVGVNEGWRVARGRWLLLLNPDVVLGSEFSQRLLERIAHHQARPEGAPGIVGFGLRNPDGSPQPSVGGEPSLFGSLRGLLESRDRRKYMKNHRLRPGPVPWVTGACALVARKLLDELGGMDGDFFLYYEEVALCRTARGRGWRVEFDPALEVTHLRPLQNRPLTPGMLLITRHSKLLYYRKHLPRWQFACLCRIVAAEAALRRWLGRGRQDRELAGWLAKLVGLMRRGEPLTGQTVRDWASGLENGCGAVLEARASDGVGTSNVHPRPPREASLGLRPPSPSG